MRHRECTEKEVAKFLVLWTTKFFVIEEIHLLLSVYDLEKIPSSKAQIFSHGRDCFWLGEEVSGNFQGSKILKSLFLA